MTSDDTVTLYYSPHTRATAARILLEELDAPYQLHVLNMLAGEQRQAAYLAVNPMGKVPAIRHNGGLVTENIAVFLYLADAFPKADLAPAIGDPLRGPYLRWLVFYGSCFEPAMQDKSMQRDSGPPQRSGYGDYDTMFNTLVGQLRPGPYMLGQRLTAADILWGSALNWMTKFNLIPALPEITGYVARVCGRPSFGKVAALDVELAAEHAKAAEATTKA
jgi:glutathione S-transferase